MIKDSPIVEDIRRIRNKISEKFDTVSLRSEWHKLTVCATSPLYQTYVR